MAEADPSIYANAYKPTVAMQSPLEAITQAAGAARSIQVNKLLQAQQAVGRAAQANVNPDGTLNLQGFGQAVAADPTAAGAALDALGTGLGQRGTAQEQGRARQTYIQAQMAGLLANPSATADDVARVLSKGVRDGMISHDEAISAAMMVPPGADTAAVHGLLNRVNAARMGAGEVNAQANGAPFEQNVGGAIVSGRRQGTFGRNPGQLDAVNVTPLGLSPGEAATQLPGTNLQGQPTAEALASRAARQGVATEGGLPGPVGSGRGPFGTGRYNPTRESIAAARGQSAGTPAAAPPNAANPYAPAAQAAGPTGAVVTGLAPGEQAKLTAQGENSTRAATSMQNAALQSDANLANLAEMREMIETYKPDAETNIRTRLAEMAKNAGLDLGNEQLAAKEVFAKIANQLAARQGQAGSGSDQWLQTAIRSNPNPDISAEGNRQIIPLLMGSEDALKARAAAWQAYNQQRGGQGDYFRFQQDMGALFDPRIYQIERMAKPQADKLVAALSPSERATLGRSYNQAVAAGLIRPGQYEGVPAVRPGAVARGY